MPLAASAHPTLVGAIPHGHPARIVFLDTETTGRLIPGELMVSQHEIWEVGVVVRDSLHGIHDVEREWQLPVQLGDADPEALALNGFYDRYVGFQDERLLTDLKTFARAFAWLTANGTTIVANNPKFDLGFLGPLLRSHDACPAWYHRTVDVRSLACGRLRVPAPWIAPGATEEICRRLGLPLERDDVHTAIGDARWCRDVYDAVMAGQGDPS